MKYFKLLIPILISCLATPFCLIIAIASSGARHGNYLAAKILFPYAMLTSELFSQITVPSIITAIIQMPFYGLFLGLANFNNKFMLSAILVTFIHVLAVIACLLFIGRNFS